MYTIMHTYVDVCLTTCPYVSYSVELESLGPLLGQVVVALSPLVDMFPQQIAGIFKFLIIESRYIGMCSHAELMCTNVDICVA